MRWTIAGAIGAQPDLAVVGGEISAPDIVGRGAVAAAGRIVELAAGDGRRDQSLLRLLESSAGAIKI